MPTNEDIVNQQKLSVTIPNFSSPVWLPRSTSTSSFGSHIWLLHLALTLASGFMVVALTFGPNVVSAIASTIFWARASPIPGGDIHSPRTMGGLVISYANVAAYEASLGGQVVHLGTCAIVPIIVSNPMIILDSNIVDEISNQVEDYSSILAIFHFRGFWPFLSDLHA